MGITPPEQAKVIRIESTLQLTALDVSNALLEEAHLHSSLEGIGKTKPLKICCCLLGDT